MYLFKSKSFQDLGYIRIFRATNHHCLFLNVLDHSMHLDTQAINCQGLVAVSKQIRHCPRRCRAAVEGLALEPQVLLTFLGCCSFLRGQGRGEQKETRLWKGPQLNHSKLLQCSYSLVSCKVPNSSVSVNRQASYQASFSAGSLSLLPICDPCTFPVPSMGY